MIDPISDALKGAIRVANELRDEVRRLKQQIEDLERVAKAQVVTIAYLKEKHRK